MALKNNISNPISNDLVTMLENLDKLRVEEIKHAEKNCRKLSMGAQQWTPLRLKIRSEIEFWELLIRQKSGIKHNVKKIIRLGKKLHMPRSDHLSLETMKTRKNRALLKWKEYIRTLDDPIREKWLNSKASYLEETGKGEKAKVLKTLINRERQRQSTRRLNAVLKDESTTGVTTVCTMENSVRCEKTTKEEIEKACLTENLARFTQAHRTTFAQQHITNEIGFMGTNSVCDNTLL